MYLFFCPKSNSESLSGPVRVTDAYEVLWHPQMESLLELQSIPSFHVYI